MNKLMKAAITERKVTFLLAVMIFLYGLYAYYFIPKQENPDTSSPTAQIITIYPGASSEEVEELVTQKIEDEVASLNGVEYMTSYSNPNVSVVIVTLNYDVDYKEQWDNLRVKLDNIKPELPQNILDYQVNTDLTSSAGIILSLSGSNYSYEQLSDYADHFKKSLEKIEGVKSINIDGEPKKNIVVTVNTKKLNTLAISIKDIYDLIQAQNVTIPAGSIETQYGKIAIKSPSSFNNISDIENLIISGSRENGGLIRIKDVASVAFEYDRTTQNYKQGEDNAVLLTVYFDQNENVVLIGEDVRSEIDSLYASQPKELKMNEVLFLPEEVSRSIEGFIMNLLQGVGFVILVVFLGMGFRNAIVVSASIPLSIAITLIVMNVIGLEIQQMSIAALIIALGMLVDNSIVISDAIQIKINEGIDLKEACYEGTAEQSIPVLTSTLTTVVAFAPLIVLPGEAGEFAKSLPIVVIIALISSYIVAMFLTPAIASVVFKNTHKEKTKKNRMRHFFESGIKGAIKMPRMSIMLIVIIIGLTVFGVKYLKIELFPYADKDLIYVDVYAEKSGDINYTDQLMKELRALLKDEADILNISSSIGGGFPKFYLTVGVRPPAEDYGQLLMKIDLSKTGQYKTREEFAYYLQNLCDENLTGGTATVSLIEINQPGPAIDLKVSGLYREDVNRVSKEIYNFMLTDPATINVQNDISEYSYQYQMDIDQDAATTLGLMNYEIQLQTSLAVNGMTSTILQNKGNQYEIIVKGDIKSIDDLENFKIKSTFLESKALLKQFSDVRLDKELSSIKRYNRNASVSVSANVRPGFSAVDLQKTIENDLLKNMDLSGVDISFGGDQEIFDKYISGLLGAAIFAVFVIYLILMIQFNSLLQPLIILLTVPLSVVGSVAILLALNQNVTFTVGLGVASLIGVVVNNAILLIDHINRERKSDKSVYDACISSVERRFRPIMLTTTTTVIGLVPMALSKSSFFTPMALALMGGLLVSTLLTLIVIPLVYKITHSESSHI